MKKFGFIGMGNMAQAMSEGFIASGKVACENIYAYAPNQEKLRCNGERIGFTPCGSIRACLMEKTCRKRLFSIVKHMERKAD